METATVSGIAVLAILAAGTIRRVIVLNRDLSEVRERVSWLEAKVNGRPK